MHPRNRSRFFYGLLALLLASGAILSAQQSASGPGQNPASDAEEQVTAEELEQLPRATSSVATMPTPSSGAPNQPSNSVQVPSRPGQAAQVERRGEQFIVRKDVQEVQLHASVYDGKQRMVTNLDRNAFTVYEDNEAQQITSFRREDVPVSLGILVDNSGSMRDKRSAVNQAALNLVRASNPEDEVFVVNFSDEYYLDQDYTSNIGQLKEALERIDSRGGTALYDAVIASATHLKSGKKQKKALLVVTDGEDNASRESLERAIRQLQAEDGPTVYTIGIMGDDRNARRAKRALQALALQTGGIAFFPRDIGEVDAISRAVAHDIRNQYIIGYKPTRPQNQGGYRNVRVEARASGYGKLQVRTRSGYFAEQQRAAKQ